ncbi:MAG: TRAP transporter large permease subunit, partial [Sneathiellaceae bacterium]
AAIYVIMIVIRCSITPSLAPKIEEKHDRAEKWRALAEVWPLPVLILIVIGGIYSGIATATEAGAFGAAAAFLIAFFQRRMSWKVARDSLVEACVSTGLVFFTAIGAILLTRFMAFAGVPFFMADLAAPISDQFILLVIGASIVFIILGMFLDPLGVLLLSLPIMLPLFEGVGADMIWFGIIVIKFLEIGLVTPPVGFNVYVIKSVVGDQIPLETIFKGVGWFIVCELVVVALLVIFPDIVLFLPSLMQ